MALAVTSLSRTFNPSAFTFSSSYPLDGDPPLKFVLSEKEKYDDDMSGVKQIFRYYESVGRMQVMSKAKEIRKLYNAAYGIIDIEEYVEVDPEFSQEMGIEELRDTVNLSFFPIIPTIVRGIIGSKDKMYSEYTASAVNPEATNELMRQMDNELRDNLFRNLEQVFMMENQGVPVNVLEQRHQLMMETEEVRRYKTLTYRTTLEEWAGHRMVLEDQMFRMNELEREVLEQIVVTDDPIVHIKYDNNRYNPEKWLEKDTFCLRSPTSKDYSESLMVGRFKYCSFADILNEYGNKMTTDQVEMVAKWGKHWTGQTFVAGGMPQFTKYQSHQESLHNVNVVQSILNQDRMRNFNSSSGTDGNLVSVTEMYFFIPRKYGVLTVVTDGDKMTHIVDESFKVTEKPMYDGKKKDADSLVYGEHIEWFYRPELWTGKKLTAYNLRLENDFSYKDGEIWIDLQPYQINLVDQATDHLYIPVHGGKVTNQFNDSSSTVKIALPTQVMYNWLMNRNQQLMSTEIGQFFALPETSIPDESLQGSWSDAHKLRNFAMLARDTKFAPLANSMGREGATNLALSGGFGQVVDMTSTNDMLGKFNLASLVEAACYRSVGLTPEFLLGDYSAEQSARSAAMGQQRTATQLQNLYTRVTSVMTRVRTTMLNIAKTIAQQEPTVELSYNSSQESRVLFRTSTQDFPLHTLGVFCKSNANDLSVIESIKNYVASNNTMGADSLEMATLMSFKSLPELFNKLRSIQDKKQMELEKERAHQQQMQEQQLQAIQQKTEAEIQAKAEENALDRDMNIAVAQIRSLGYAQGTPEEVQKAILDLRTANDEQRRLFEQTSLQYRNQALKEQTAQQSLEQRQAMDTFRQRMDLKKVEQKDRELELRKMDIQARNARTKELDKVPK